MSEPATLSELVERAVAGDEQAWAVVVDRFAPLVWSICRRYRLSPSDADDVVQAVWLRLLEHLPALREPDAMPGWVATTAGRECLRHLSRAQRRTARELPVVDELLEDHAAAQTDDLEEALMQAQRADALRQAFGALGERCRGLLGLLLRDPAPSYAQIGAELGMPVGSIGPTRARCLDTLRRRPEVAAVRLAQLRGGR